jgi:hypothetical protein
MPRSRLPVAVEQQVLLLSRRRCCICFGLDVDMSQKQGQIAHLDRNPDNDKIHNLAFFCLQHHDQYDTRTSQSKGFQEAEVREFRRELYDVLRRERGKFNDPGAGDRIPKEEARPLVELNFESEGREKQPPDYVANLSLEIINWGGWPISRVGIQPTEYTLERRAVIVGMSAFGHHSVLFAERVEPNGGSSGRISIRDLMPMLRLEKLGSFGGTHPLPVRERFYAFRITLFHGGSRKRYAIYRVINANHPYLIMDESNFGYSSAGTTEAVAMSWIQQPRRVIVEHQRRLFATYQDEEHTSLAPTKPLA